MELRLAGRAVAVDIHAPASRAPAAVVLAHGFMRTRATLDGHAAALAQRGWLAIVPDLPYLSASADNALALNELIAMVRAGTLAPAVDRLVLVGFSAGGLAALLAAANPGVVGYIGLDPIDHAAGEGLAAARSLRIPAILLHGPPSSCNAGRNAATWTAALPALVEDSLITDASHCDFESPTDAWCTLLCGATEPVRQQLVRDALLVAVHDLLPPAPPPMAPVLQDTASSPLPAPANPKEFP